MERNQCAIKYLDIFMSGLDMFFFHFNLYSFSSILTAFFPFPPFPPINLSNFTEVQWYTCSPNGDLVPITKTLTEKLQGQ